MDKKSRAQVLGEYWGKRISESEAASEPIKNVGAICEALLVDDIDAIINLKGLSSLPTDPKKSAYTRFFSFSENDMFIYISNVVPTVTAEFPKFTVKKVLKRELLKVDKVKLICEDFWESESLTDMISLIVTTALMYPFAAIKTRIVDISKRTVSVSFVNPMNICIDCESQSMKEKDIRWVAEKVSVSYLECKKWELKNMNDILEQYKSKFDEVPEEYRDFIEIEFYEIWDKRTGKVLYYNEKTKLIHFEKEVDYFKNINKYFDGLFFPYTFINFYDSPSGMAYSPSKAFYKRIITKRLITSKLVDNLMVSSNMKVVYDASTEMSQSMLEQFISSDAPATIGVDMSMSKQVPVNVQTKADTVPLEMIQGLQDKFVKEETGITRIERGDAPASRETATFTAGVMSASKTKFSILGRRIESFIGTVFTKLTVLWTEVGYKRDIVEDVLINKREIYPCRIKVLKDSMIQENRALEIQLLLMVSQAVMQISQVSQAMPNIPMDKIVDYIFKKSEFDIKGLLSEEKEAMKVDEATGVSPDELASSIVEEAKKNGQMGRLRSNIAEGRETEILAPGNAAPEELPVMPGGEAETPQGVTQ